MVENDVTESNIPDAMVVITWRHAPNSQPDAIVNRKVPYKHVLRTLGDFVIFLAGLDSHGVIKIGNCDVLYKHIGRCGVNAVSVEGKRWDPDTSFRPES